MIRLADIGPGQLFAWQGGIFVKSDTVKPGKDNNGQPITDAMWAVTIIRKTMPTVSGVPTDSNHLGATIWMGKNTEVSLLTADIYHGDACIHRMWENQVDNELDGGIVGA